MKTKCLICKKEIQSKKSDKEDLHYFFCETDKIGGKGKTEIEAKNSFLKNLSIEIEKNKPSTALVSMPKKQTDLLPWVIKQMEMLVQESAQFIDKPALRRMIMKNTKHVLNSDLKDVWKTPEGVESVVDALQYSFEIGATLPEMGSIVPYGKTAEFIPAIAAFTFALTSGKNPPFSSINVECIYENDIYEMGSKNGNFNFEMKKIGFPRGEIVGVVVQATHTETGLIIGDAYDENRLMGKAEKHSISYKYYLADVAALAKAQTEGKDFIVKWGKNFYEKDIQNPYVGADKPEMLKKLAGKSFFNQYMKVRNARAMEAEWNEGDGIDNPVQSHNKTVDKILDKAIEQVDIVVDAEFKTVEKTPAEVPEKVSEKKTLFTE